MPGAALQGGVAVASEALAKEAVPRLVWRAEASPSKNPPGTAGSTCPA